MFYKQIFLLKFTIICILNLIIASNTDLYVLKLLGEPTEIRNFTDEHGLQLVHKVYKPKN